MFFSTDGFYEEYLLAKVNQLEWEVKRLKWLLKCKDDPTLCPCGGKRGDYYSHAKDCKNINLYRRGKDYGSLTA